MLILVTNAINSDCSNSPQHALNFSKKLRSDTGISFGTHETYRKVGGLKVTKNGAMLERFGDMGRIKIQTGAFVFYYNSLFFNNIRSFLTLKTNFIQARKTQKCRQSCTINYHFSKTVPILRYAENNIPK